MDDEWDEVIFAQGGERLSVSACVAPNKHCERGLKQKKKKPTLDKTPEILYAKNSINANAVE